MKESATPTLSIDQYIQRFPEEIQARLTQIRVTIRETAPQATEKISYQMPAFEFNGILVYFAAYQGHIGFYPTGSGIAAFQDKLGGYQTSKGTIQFPHDRPLPLDLVREIVLHRVGENAKKSKKSKKSS